LTVNLPSDAVLLAGAALLVAGVLCAGFADRLRAPGLLLFLGLGMALGSDGLGLIDFSDAGQAQSIGVAALVVILYEGGLSTSPRELRRVAGPGLALATLGVFVTAVVVALGALVVLDVPITTALLLGAVVSSTDAAAVFSVLRQAPLPSRLKVLLEAESGGNDPMAVLLTVGFIQVAAGGVTAGDWLVFGVRQLAGGLLVGAAVGWLGSTALARLRFSSPALYPVLGLGVAGLAYGCAALLGTSGFLAAYVAGVVVGARAPRRRRAVRTFHEGLASTSQIVLLLGLLVFPSRLPGVALPALAVAATLVFVARPLAVAVSLPWFGFSLRELGFASWAGLRGAIPIVLATFPLTAGHPDGQVIFDVTFFVVLVSAAVQGLTVAPLARRLGLESTTSGWAGLAEVVPLDAVGIDVVEIDVPTGSRVVGQPLREVPLPLDARVAAIVRRGEVVVPNGDSHLEEGDLLVVFARRRGELAGAITDWASG
jgi:cell volume regulation protein A